MTLTFTAEEKQLLKCSIFDQNIDRENFDDKGLPTDIHLVEYTIGDVLYVDVVRAYKVVDIFDPYYDKLKTLGGELISITNGYGNLRPNMYQGTIPAAD